MRRRQHCPRALRCKAALSTAKSKQRSPGATPGGSTGRRSSSPAQYSLFAKFNNYQVYFPPNTFRYNNAGIGIQMSWPIFDHALKDKAEESAADAAHAFADYDNARIKEQEGHAQLARSTRTLAAKAEVADLQQQFASQQLAVHPNAASGQRREPQRCRSAHPKTRPTRKSTSAASTSRCSTRASIFSRRRCS